MSTPEERLRQQADAIKAAREARERREREDEAKLKADLRERTGRSTAEAQAWLNRAKEMIDATRMRVPLKMDSDLKDGPGFEITIGGARLRLMLETNGWHVRVASPSDLHPQTGLPLDPAGIRENVLERMVLQGLKDLDEGRVEPGPQW